MAKGQGGQMDPAGRHALVTGGASGIGAAIVRLLRQAGAVVTVVGRRPHDDPFYQQADVTDLVAVQAAIQRAETQYGDRKSTRLNSSHLRLSRMPSSA